jgi:hypothetical protein
MCSGVTLNYSLVSKVTACTTPSSDSFSFDNGITPVLQVGTVLYQGFTCSGAFALDGFYQDPNNSTIIYRITGGVGEITSVEYCSDVEYYISNCCTGANWRINTGGVIPTWNVGDYVGLTLSSPGGSNPENGCYQVVTIPDSFSSYNWNYPLDTFNNYGASDCNICFAGEGEVCTSPTPTPTITSTNTPTITPTQTVTPSNCACSYFDVVISQTDLDNATGNSDPYADNTVYVSYTNCSNVFVTDIYTTAGSFPNSICVKNGFYGSVIVEYYVTNNPVTGLSNATNTGNCCIAPTPTPTPTISITPSVSPTPSVTPTIGCKCLYVDSNIESIATGNTINPALNGVAIYEYTDCYDNIIEFTGITGHGIFYFCTKNGVIDNITIVQDNVEYSSGTLIPPTSWIPTIPIINESIAGAQVLLNSICSGDPCDPNLPTPTPTNTGTETPTPTVTPTVTPTPNPTGALTQTPTPTNTGTETPTPTPTPTNTETPTNTPTNTQTPSVTPTDEAFDIYTFKDCCNPDTKFRFNNVTGTLIVGQVFYIGGSGDFDGCAEVIPYESSGPIYGGIGVSFTEQISCDDSLCAAVPCPTPTPSPIVICPCKDYFVTNTNPLGVYVGYVDCIGTDREIYIGPLTSIQLCACLDSVLGPTGVIIVLQGDCPPTTGTPNPTPSFTPTPTPTPIACSVDEYCLLTYYPETEIYDGTYYSAPTTFNGRSYYTGDTAFIYFTGTTWCLSENLGGECIIVGKTCNGPCPNFSEDFFTSGVCVTTTTTVNPCNVFDFEAYFDCDVSTTTTTTIPCSATSVDVSFSAYTTTTTTVNPCLSVGGVITISGYTTTTTTIPTTTTTTTSRDVPADGNVTFTLVDTIFICPGQTYEFQDCNTETNYYIEPSTNFNSVDLLTNYAYLMTINEIEGCYTFIGVSSVSPNATVTNIDSWYGECTTCQNNI